MKYFKWGMILFMIGIALGLAAYFLNGSPNTHEPYAELSKIQTHLPPKVLNLPDDRRIKTTFPNMGLNASSVVLMNAHNGDILYEKNADESLPTASMSKMMTEYLVLQAIDNKHKITWNTPVTISDYVNYISNHPGFASVHLQKGKQYTVREIFNAMAVRSANGAAIALAETVAGSEKAFVEEMNQAVLKLGLKNSHFVDSTGLNNSDLGPYYSTGGPTDTNRMSAADVVRLAQQLIQKYPEILNVIDRPKISFQGRNYTNTNWMLPGVKKDIGYQGVDGLKTGYTDEAGYCFVGTIERNHKRLISVVMGTNTKLARFTETKELYETAFELFK